MVVYRKKHKKVYDISNNFHGGLYLYLSKAREEWESMKGLQSVYNQITNILKENNVLMNITPPRPYLIKKDDEERINAETESLLKGGKIKEYNSKMEEKEAYKLYFDEAYKYTNFYEEGDEWDERHIPSGLPARKERNKN